MAWVGDAIFSLVLSTVVGITCNCPENPETVQRDLRELGPQIMLAPPRIWENMLTTINVKAADASPFKRFVFNYFRGLAERVELARSEKRPSIVRSAAHALAGRIPGLRAGARSARPAPAALGLYRRRAAGRRHVPHVQGLRRQPEAGLRLDRDLGPGRDPERQRGRSQHGRAGPAPASKSRSATTAKCCSRARASSPATTSRKKPRATPSTPRAGSIPAMPASSIPTGHLVIIDRAKDVGKMADGTPFAPQFIENKLKFSPFIREAISFGNQRPYVVAMIAIDLTTAGNWAEKRGLAYTSYVDLAQKPEMAELIRGEIEKCNAGPAAGDPDPPLPAADQGFRRRRCGDHAHPQAAPRLHRRQVRAGDRRVLQRRRPDRTGQRSHLRGRPQGDRPFERHHSRS